ncbi:exopolysaccharide biosynthesis polyprenyl glycosylphosphotransferase [Pedobacter namyangjuensis]|uniref:exopolysaccharide biosynthesis polyprenyl glycosylphosphotransferase n=1 Tax=Pedobacter namyangjuensis TaxID=600626 RepID=UPI000DE4FAA7|nr:exopolysaccharide biosynthesis polyprenyl glycosylphosphotransferase [Pedobacter namyangjuensis]
MQNRYVFILIALLAVFDAIAINSSYAVLYFFDIIKHDELNISVSIAYLIKLNLSWILAALLTKLYSYQSLQQNRSIWLKSLQTIALQLTAFTVLSLAFSAFDLLQHYIVIAILLQILFLALVRAGIYFTKNYYLNADLIRKRIAIVGGNDINLRLEKYFMQNQLSYEFTGTYPDIKTDTKTQSDSLEDLESTIHFAIENNLDEVYTSLFPENHTGLDNLIALAEQNCVRVKFVTSFLEFQNQEATFATENYKLSRFYDGIPILVARNEPLDLVWNRLIKRSFDIVFSLCVIVFLLSWLLPILMIAIMIESKGAPIFTQARSGRNNKSFLCFKLRSMRLNADSNKQQATKNDPRITKIGSFMRKTSLDELPQFFNVLMGNMSVVGPRPHMLKHTEEYRKIISQYMVRHYLKPGITGWAQINGHRGETKIHQQMLDRVEHDVWYMENWSLSKDVEIILKTVTNALKGEDNAY